MFEKFLISLQKKNDKEKIHNYLFRVCLPYLQLGNERLNDAQVLIMNTSVISLASHLKTRE